MMSCRRTALSVFLLLFLRVQSIDLTHARSVPSLSGFEPPEVDGSAVDICRIFIVPTPEPPTTKTTTTTTTRPTTTTTTTTAPPITRKRVVVTTKKPAVQSQPRKPETKNTGTPIRPQPAPAGPISNSLLYYLLTNSRAISQPIGRLPHRGYSMTSSDSDESAAGSSSSEDSSDES